MLNLFYSIGISKSAFLLLTLTLGVLLRFVWMNDRPLHHDESLHAQLSFNFFRNPERDYYRYDPAYHGPTLYILLRYFYHFCDYSEKYCPRLPLVIISVFLLFLVLNLRPLLGNEETFWILICLSLSPSIVYFASWIREDQIVLLGVFFTVFGIIYKIPIFTFVGIVLQLATKANFFIHIGLFLAFKLYETCKKELSRVGKLYELCRGVKFTLASFVDFLLKLPVKFKACASRKWFLGFLCGVFLFVYLVTTEFRNWKAIQDIFVENIRHWYSMHKQERIEGPFSYHFNLISFYEQPLFFVTLMTCLHFILTQITSVLVVLVLTVLLVFPILIIATPFGSSGWEILNSFNWFREFSLLLKIKGGFDLIFCVYLFSFGFLITDFFYSRDKRLSVLSFIFFSNFFVYSYVGEKVPWLSVYIVLTGYIFNCCYWSKFKNEFIKLFVFIVLILASYKASFGLLDSIILNKAERVKSLLIFYGIPTVLTLTSSFLIFWCKNLELSINQKVSTVLTIFIFLLLNFRVVGSLTSREITLLSQVHTNRVFEAFVENLVSETRVKINNDVKIGYFGDVYWPLVWYVKNNPSFVYIDGLEWAKQLDCSFANHDQSLSGIGFNETLIPFRSWAYFDLNHAKFRDFFKGVFFGENVVGRGILYVKFGCREGVKF
ncbi:MAG: TIGR03663 family protein [Deltaproteobacteria bacterium]|nr:TIGR03663 family protein [Deltaproteobacteria bacterium]